MPWAMPPWIWPSTEGRIDGAADVVRRMDVQQRHRAELDVDLDLGDLRREAVGRVRHALAVGIERHGRRIEVAAAGRDVAARVGGQLPELEQPLLAIAARTDQPPAVQTKARQVALPRRRIARRRRCRQRPAASVGRRLNPASPRALRRRSSPRAVPRCRRRRSGATPTTCRRRRCIGVAHHLLDSASGRPTASANICGMIVAVPWPISCAPL